MATKKSSGDGSGVAIAYLNKHKAGGSKGSKSDMPMKSSGKGKPSKKGC